MRVTQDLPKPDRMLTVTAGTTCIGFILHRGPQGFEAFDYTGAKSLGIFPTRHDAVLAIPAPAKEPA